MGKNDIRWAGEPARNVKLLTVPEAAARLSVSTAKIWQLLKRGDLCGVKIDNSRRIADDEIDAYIAGLAAEEQARRAGSAA